MFRSSAQSARSRNRCVLTEHITNDVRFGTYVDSVALMRLSQSILRLEGIQEAALMMGTPANLEIMNDARLLNEVGRAASGGDLVIAIRADNSAAADVALAEAQGLLNRSSAGSREGATWQPSSLRAAVNAMPEANLALISVPGEFAAAEARKAIRRGLHTMIFSDNVSIDDEVAIKREALEAGVLAMGPDCGTAIINGTPLAFANVVRRGNVGIVGASGTGIQEVTCLIDQLGGGISHAIGVGGRDLSTEVGGISTLMALEVLENDYETDHLVLISKPPPKEVADKILQRVAQSKKAVTICFLGSRNLVSPVNATQAMTLESAAELASGKQLPDFDNTESKKTFATRAGIIRGLFSGGTLCTEAQLIIQDAGQTITSNVPIAGAGPIGSEARAHVLLDLGDDEFTKGKPHPMIDPSVRSPALRDALTSTDTAAILLDVVIGYGSHSDPAGEIISVLNEVSSENRPIIIASVTGTDADPQSRSMQVAKLKTAGVQVAQSNAHAARLATKAIEKIS